MNIFGINDGASAWVRLKAYRVDRNRVLPFVGQSLQLGCPNSALFASPSPNQSASGLCLAENYILGFSRNPSPPQPLIDRRIPPFPPKSRSNQSTRSIIGSAVCARHHDRRGYQSPPSEHPQHRPRRLQRLSLRPELGLSSCCACLVSCKDLFGLGQIVSEVF